MPGSPACRRDSLWYDLHHPRHPPTRILRCDASPPVNPKPQTCDVNPPGPFLIHASPRIILATRRALHHSMLRIRCIDTLRFQIHSGISDFEWNGPKFGLVVSNPPYIPSQNMSSLEPEASIRPSNLYIRIPSTDPKSYQPCIPEARDHELDSQPSTSCLPPSIHSHQNTIYISPT